MDVYGQRKNWKWLTKYMCFEVMRCIISINKENVGPWCTVGSEACTFQAECRVGMGVPADTSTGRKARDRCPPREHRTLPESRAPGIFGRIGPIIMETPCAT